MSEQPDPPAKRLGRISARTGRPITGNGEDAKAGGTPDGTVFEAAERTAEFFDHLHTHYRKMRRTDVRIPARVKLLLENNTVYDTGTATVTNISPSGLLLADVKLPQQSYPTAPFKLEILMQSGDWEGIGLEAVPVRFEPKHHGLGVKYAEIFIAVEPKA